MSNEKKPKPREEAPPKPALILPDEVKARAAAIADAKKVNGAEVLDPIEGEPEREQTLVREIAAASCGNCRFFVRMTKGKSLNGSYEVDSGQCRARSPHALVVGMQQHPITQAVNPVVNGYFPPTNEEIWCGEWRSRMPMPDEDSLN